MWKRPKKLVVLFIRILSVAIAALLVLLLERRLGSPHLKLRLLFWSHSSSSAADNYYYYHYPVNLSNRRTFFNQVIRGPGVILDVKGGIGNQLFQYACLYAAARDLNATLYTLLKPNRAAADADLLKQRSFLPDQREFALDKFQIPLDNFIDDSSLLDGLAVRRVTDWDLLAGNNFSSKMKPLITPDPELYCQSEQYWTKYRDELKPLFKSKPELVGSPKILDFLSQIEGSESVGVHVRRGDFVNRTRSFVPISFQRRAIRRIAKMLKPKKSPIFFVFSDDIAYARAALDDLSHHQKLSGGPGGPGPGYKFIYVSEANNTSIEEFYLMGQCKHFIFPSSTFSWWAAYLIENQRKIIITSVFNPKFWEIQEAEGEAEAEGRLGFYRMLYGDMYFPPGWIVVNPFVPEAF